MKCYVLLKEIFKGISLSSNTSASRFTDLAANVEKTCGVGSMVEWLKHRTHDQHGLHSKPTHAILLCLWERHFTAHSPAWWSWQAVLNYSQISIKLQVDSNILASLEAGWGNCLPYVLVLPSLSCE